MGKVERQSTPARILLTVLTMVALAVVSGGAVAAADQGDTIRVSVDSTGVEGDNRSRDSVITDDGRQVVFRSIASNLVPGDTNAITDVFLHDRDSGVTYRISVDSAGLESNDESSQPSVSGSGRYVSFSSTASNLVPDDTNGANDVFVHDRVTGATSRISVDSSGTEANADSFSAYGGAISEDGRYVALLSLATNLVPGDTNGAIDVFVHDRVTGATSRASVDSAGLQGDQDSYDPVLSADGRLVLFQSFASNLVDDDTNGFLDVFVHDLDTGVTSRVSVDSTGTQGNGDS